MGKKNPKRAHRNGSPRRSRPVGPDATGTLCLEPMSTTTIVRAIPEAETIQAMYDFVRSGN